MMRISIVIPTLNEEVAIERTLESVQRVTGICEILVADGGSSDATCPVAERKGVRVVRSAANRGAQMHAGAQAAIGDVLWFLHADTIAPTESGEAIVRALADPSVVAGNFALRFDGTSGGASQLTRIYPHLRKIGLCYGDSGIFVRGTAYKACGGFGNHPLFEDLDLLRRVRPLGKFVHLDCALVTSSRRFESRNFAGMFAFWSALQLLYWAGVSPVTLAKWYGPVRPRA